MVWRVLMALQVFEVLIRIDKDCTFGVNWDFLPSLPLLVPLRQFQLGR